MINLQGKRNSALIFADKIDGPTKTQIASLLRQEAYADSKIRIMPDTHSGRHVAVGTTMTLHGRISPLLLGVDLGCGMEALFLENGDCDLPLLDKQIHRLIPCGSKIHEDAVSSFDLSDLHCKEFIDQARAQRSIGTLGGGNHFIELQEDENGMCCIMLHSGSRHFGNMIGQYFNKIAANLNAKWHYSVDP